jgi:hypothetical protein
MQDQKINKILYIFFSFSLMIGLFFGEDSSGSGGFIVDFNSTWPLVESPLKYTISGLGDYEIKFPLHYYIASIIYFLVQDKFLFRFVYCSIALFIPYLFFLCLKNKYENIDRNNLFIFSLLIFILPSFRSAAIWPNTQITAIIFFLFSLLYFVKWEKNKSFEKLNSDLLLTIVFMSLTVYTRQLYAMIFLYFVLVFFQKLKFQTFVLTCFIIALFAIPGLFFIYYYPTILQATFDSNIQNSLLVNASIISFYLIPFYFVLFFKNKSYVQINISASLIHILLIFVLVVFLSFLFNYNFRMGGGFFIKLSILLFDNLYFFFLTSFLGFIFLYFISRQSLNNSILSLILLFGFSAYIIFAKYFEPMFIILLFLVFQTNITNEFLKRKKDILLFHSYFIIYLISALINDALGITKSL